MANFNKAVIGGNLTKDPELRFTSTGKAVCDFNLAINRRRGTTDSADFVSVTAWEDLAEIIADHKQKGDGVIVEGRTRYDAWEAPDGSKRSKVTVIASNVQFMPAGSSMRLNKVLLAGNLTRDPIHELVGDDGSIAKAEFGIAVGRGEDAVDFFDVTAWRGLADAVTKNKAKGHPVLIEGRLQYSTWVKDGATRSKVEVVAENIDYLVQKEYAKKSSASPAPAANGTGATATVVDDDFSDMPF